MKTITALIILLAASTVFAESYRSIEFEWEKYPQNMADYFNLYMDGAIYVPNIPITDTTIKVDYLQDKDHEYYLTAVRTSYDPGESGPSDKVTVEPNIIVPTVERIINNETK